MKVHTADRNIKIWHMRKRKPVSGNGTHRRQWLYLYVNIPLIIFVKIGISGDYLRRASQVNKDAFGWAIPVFAVKIPFAWQCEQALHRLFRFMSVPFGGSREWFLLPVAPLAVAVMLFAWAVEWAFWILLVIAGLWVWGWLIA